MENKNIRKYNLEFRRNLKQKISKITNKPDLIEIYKIVNGEFENKLTINQNGIYFNLNQLSDKSMESILKIISDKDDTETATEQQQFKFKYEIYSKDTVIDNFIQNHKLTNQEKTLIKKFHQES